MIVTNGKILFADNMYVLEIEGAQGEPFPFKDQEGQINALKELTQYAKDNNINIINKAEFPPVNNKVELITEDKPVNEAATITYEGNFKPFKTYSFDEFWKDVDKSLDSTRDLSGDKENNKHFWNMHEPNSNKNIADIVPASAAEVIKTWNKTNTIVGGNGEKEIDKDLKPVKESVYSKIYESNSFELKPEIKVLTESLSLLMETRVDPLKEAGYSLDEIKEIICEAIEIRFNEIE